MSGIKDLNHMTQGELAELWGISTRTIQRKTELDYLRHGSGLTIYYVWAECRRHELESLSQQAAGSTPSDKEREQKAKADIAEMEAYTMAGETLDRAETVLVWSAFLGRLKESIRGISLRVAPRLEDGMLVGEREAIIGREIDQTLRDVVAELARTEEVA